MIWPQNLNRSKSATQYPAVHKSQVGVCNNVTVFMWFSVFLSNTLARSLFLSLSVFTDENCRDRRHNCVMVVQARLCVYSYYKSACCASCTQSAQRAKRHWPANHRQPRCARCQGLGQKGWRQVLRSRQPWADIIPAMAVRKHLAIFSWFFRLYTVKAASSLFQFSVCYFISSFRST